MVKALNMNPTLPKTGRLSEGLDDSEDLISPVIVRRSTGLTELALLDVEFAPLFDRAVDGYGSAKESAIDLGHSETHVSYMRCGKKPAPLRDLGRLLRRRASFVSFAEPIAAEHGFRLEPIRRLTKEELAEELRRFMSESGPLLKLFVREVAVRRGIDPEEVLKALGQ